MTTVLRKLRTLPLRKAQLYYETKLELPYTMDDVQHDDWEFIENNTKCVVVRSRGGSKTFDFVNWLIFHVLRTNEKWGWLACKGGQLAQAMEYVEANKYVKYVHCETTSKYNVWLWSGRMIRFGIISTSNLGLRLDGLIFDEFEDLLPKQEVHVYPQMAGMMTHSAVHKSVFLGTLWTRCLLNEYSEVLPTLIRPWDTLPWLVKAGMIQAEIDEGIVPDWEIDLLYRCIPSSPHGLVFPNIIEANFDELDLHQPADMFGIDFGSTDHCVGVYVDEELKRIYIMDEWEVSLEAHNSAFDFLSGKNIEAESGGYNDNDKYAAKSLMMRDRIGAMRQPVTPKWKSERVMYARGYTIYADRRRTPLTFKDIKKSIYGDDGLYKKTSGALTLYQCHWLDAFLHAVKVVSHSYTESGYTTPRRSDILRNQKRRAERYT